MVPHHRKLYLLLLNTKYPPIVPSNSLTAVSYTHLSGARKPSGADDRLTEAVKKAAGTLDIRLWDHVIVAGNNYYSYADEGKPVSYTHLDVYKRQLMNNSSDTDLPFSMFATVKGLSLIHI